MKSIFTYLKRKKFFKRSVRDVSMYIHSGKYVYNFNADYAVLNNSTEKIRAKELFSDKFNIKISKLFYVIKKILSFGKIKVNNKEMKVKNFSASLILLTYQEKSLKLFDFENNKVLTKYFCDKDYLMTIDNHDFFNSSFKTPRLLDRDSNKLIIIEELINYQQTSEIEDVKKDELIKDIFTSYKKYISNYNNQKNHLNFNYIENNDIFIDEFKNKKIPMIKSLGDLMYKNILYFEESFYYIDFEMSSFTSLLFDFFTFIFYAYTKNNEVRFYSNYINGLYDDDITDLFEMFECKFYREYREEYFKLFLCERVKIEEKFSASFSRESFFNDYKKMKEIVEF